MSEVLAPQPEMPTWVEYLGMLAGEVPEIAEKQQQLVPAMADIIERYNMKPELFEEPAYTLVLAAMASCVIEGESIEDGSFLDQVAHVLRNCEENDGLECSEATERLIVERYTDFRMTAAVKQLIEDEGLLDNVKRKMGITGDNEDPYDLRVLSITLSNQAEDIEYIAARREGDPAGLYPAEPDEDVLRWRRGLEERKNEFMATMDRSGRLRNSAAWTSSVDVPTMFISLPLAEKLLDPSLAHDWQEAEQAVAILEHEYAHTQGGLESGDGRIGISLEELRAEHFSGNMCAYEDVKSFFATYYTFTGRDMPALFGAIPKGGSPGFIFSRIAQDVGLNLMLEVVLCQPHHYASKEMNEHMKAVNEYIDTPNAVLNKILFRQLILGLRGEIASRTTTDKERRGLNFVIKVVEQMESDKILEFAPATEL